MRTRVHVVAPLALVLLLPVFGAERTAQENYKKHCVECHGSDGRSQTRLGRKSGAKDLSSPENQAKLTDEDAFNGIKNGRKNSKGEEKMEAFGHLLSDHEIKELVAYVRTFAKQK